MRRSGNVAPTMDRRATEGIAEARKDVARAVERDADDATRGARTGVKLQCPEKSHQIGPLLGRQANIEALIIEIHDRFEVGGETIVEIGCAGS